jgi:hypothetical protein
VTKEFEVSWSTSPGEETRTIPKKGLAELQIVAVLRQVEAGAGGGDLPQGGDQPGDVLSVEAAVIRGGESELRELRQFRAENGRLKRLVADLSTNRQILQEIVYKAVRLRAGRKLARWAQEAYRISERPRTKTSRVLTRRFYGKFLIPELLALLSAIRCSDYPWSHCVLTFTAVPS